MRKFPRMAKSNCVQLHHFTLSLLLQEEECLQNKYNIRLSLIWVVDSGNLGMGSQCLYSSYNYCVQIRIYLISAFICTQLQLSNVSGKRLNMHN